LSGQYLYRMDLRELIEHGAYRYSPTMYGHELFEALSSTKYRQNGRLPIDSQKSLIVVPSGEHSSSGVLY
jgi:hypothetical protein